MAFEGMDIAEVRSFASAVAGAADALDAAADRLDGELARSPWMGPDAARFRSEWTGSHRGALRSTATRLRAAQRLLIAQADDQERTAGTSEGGTLADHGVGRIGASRGGGGVPATVGGRTDIWGSLAPVPRTLTGLIPGLQGAVGDAADLAMGTPLLGGLISAGFGFQYVKGQDFYTTNQTSIQSHLGFMDAFDQAGFAGGMDLDDSTSEFSYGGRDYRLELWKGSYGAGSAFGGEVGLYIRDPSKDVLQSPGQAIDGFYPAADPADRIHIVQSIYDVHTGETYFTSDGHQTLGEDQYWNAAIRTTPGLDKSDLGQRGTLYVDDPGLRQAMGAAMAREGVAVRIDDAAGTVVYDWGR